MATGPLIILIGGGGLLAYLIYDWLQYRLRRRRRKEVQESGVMGKVSYDWRVYVTVILSVVTAYLYARPIERVTETVTGFDPIVEIKHSYLVAIYVLLVGIWWAVRQARKEAVSLRGLVNEQVTELVGQFRSVFRIRPTVFSALEEANRKIPPPTGAAVSHAVTTFYVTSMPKRALDELRERVDNPYMEQFIYILERGEDARHEDIMNALDGLLHRVRRAREIRDQSEVNMTVITGQSKIIQFIAVSLVVVVGAVPLLRQAYENVIGQMVFLFVASIGVSTSWYIERQAIKLKEKVL
ncbi:MAG: hypothetical protein H6648_04855 [Caldilineae bacterium]|nr:hypothetical protein [Chloroflexota bacterium]MCB9176470.1 hypothetical protein [Caldilineae bacterium]